MNSPHSDDVSFTTRWGRLDLSARQDPSGGAVLLATAVGFVGLGLVRAGLAHARGFARTHPEGWNYVADTTRVRALNPANALVLRRIHGLPYLERYVVVVPGAFRRWALTRLAPVVGADEIVTARPPLNPAGEATTAEQCDAWLPQLRKFSNSNGMP